MQEGHCPLGQADADLTLAGSGEFFDHSHEVGEGLRFHCSHNVGAVEFDRPLRSSEFSGDLFIKHPGCNERHYFALAWFSRL